MDFDEQQAIKYIREHCPGLPNYDDDEYLNVIDMIFDFYESNGLLDISLDDDDDDDDDVDIAEIIDYVQRMVRKDKGSKLSTDHVEPIVTAYLEYEDSLML